MNSYLLRFFKTLPIILIMIIAYIYQDLLINSLFKVTDLGLMVILWLFVLYSLNWILKGWKWRLLLNTSEYSIIELTYIIILGNFTSLVVPAKGGDLIRIRLSKESNLSKTEIIASTLMDRVWDLFGILFSMLLLFVIFQPFQIINTGYFFVGLILLSLGLILTYFFLPKYSNRIEAKTPEIINPFVVKFLNGLKLTRYKNLPTIILLSVVIWMIEGMLLTIVIVQFIPNITWWLVILAVLMANITKIIPLTPGGFVIYEGVIGFVISELGEIELAIAVEFGILDSIFKNGYTIVIGILTYYYWFLRDRHQIKV